MRYIDVCSGISAPTMAWKPLGWQALCFAEIEAAPRAVLAHHYPQVPLRGDFTEIEGNEYGPVDLLVGGTPCQSFSVAGLRGGMADSRGNLALEFARLADRARPRWVVWENVPGVLSSNGGRDFGSILGALAELGYGTAYRVLDAQHFGVPQRRRRVFAIGYLGDWRRAAAVLFERHSLSGHPAPRREKGQSAPTIPSRSSAGGGLGTDFDCDGGLIQAFGGGNQSGAIDIATTQTAHGVRLDFDSETFIAHSLRGEGFDASEDGTGRGTPLVPVHCFDARQSDVLQYGDKTGPLDTDAYTHAICFSAKDHGADAMHDLSPTLRAGGHGSSHANAGVMPAIAFDTTQITSASNYSNPCHPLAAQAHVPAVAFDMRGREGGAQFEGPHDSANLRAASGGSSRSYVAASAVRRLTPRECERLQGFPDDFTLVPNRGKPMADGPRYKMLGNSMAVPVLRWIGERIKMVDHLAASQLASAA